MASYRRWGRWTLLLLISSVAFAHLAFAQIDIVTERYDPSRLGANLQETQLNTSNVNVGTFGKLWSYTVSGSVFAQPLYVRNVTIPDQGTHNVLYVVTMNDVVYAFDADSSSDTPLLSVDLTSEVPGSAPVPITDITNPVNITGNLGIESTPYIDLATNTMYLVAQTKEAGGQCGDAAVSQGQGDYCHRLHALDITTLAEKFGGPTMIQGSVPGTGAASVGGALTFDPWLENQRSSLGFSNGQIFIAWSSHEDQHPYHGWMMTYDAVTLQQTSIFSSTPDGTQGGIWMAGRAPVIDADGYVYYMTGNGTWDGTRGFGESFVKFDSSNGVPLLDWFTPSNWGSLNGDDLDLGGSGPILIPGTDLIIGGGKSGEFYMTHTADMGHETGDDAQIVQEFQNGQGQQIKGGPVYWNRFGVSADVGPWMYVWADNHSRLNAYHFNGTTFDTTPISQSTLVSVSGSSGGVLTLSANGNTPGSGILWASIAYPDTGDPNGQVHPGVLRAIDANDVTTELWNSNIDAARDSSGNWPKFSPPTVVNGRVYLASYPVDGISDAPLSVYGLLPVPDFTIAATPPNPGVNPGSVATYTIATGSVNGFADPIHLSVDGLPADSTAMFAGNDSAPGTTILTVQTAADTSTGANTLTITATSGALTHTASVGLLVTNTIPGTGVISVNFIGGATPIAATDSAGVIAQVNWNEASGATGSDLALVDETGTSTGVNVAWNAASTGTLGIADEPGNFGMMNGYLDAGDQSATVTITNLPGDAAGYYVYVYADGANGTTSDSGTYTLSGADATPAQLEVTDAANTDFNGTFTRANNGAGNYAVVLVNGTGFTLTATAVSTTGGINANAPINAIQIVHGDRIFANGFE